jgi:quercetin dioxygenase-like cupin family protein
MRRSSMEVSNLAWSDSGSDPGDAFAYILEGTLILEVDGQTPVTLKPGDSGSVRPGQIHDDRNGSQTQPLKFLVFHIARKGQPLAIPAK